MRKRVPPTRMVVLLLGLLVASTLPASGQDGSPAPSSGPSPAPSPGPSVVPVAPTAPVVRRWAAAADPDVRRGGVVEHVVALGEELIAFAPRVGSDGQTSARILASADGATWVRRGRIRLTGTIRAVIADGSALLAVGWDEGAAIWRSVDAGRTWALPEDASPFAGGADGRPALDEGAEVMAVARGPAGLLAVGASADPGRVTRRGAAWRSSDGLAWERLAEAGAGDPVTALAADGESYVALTSAPSAPPRWSTDGLTWTDATGLPGPGETVAGLLAVPGLGFLAWGAPTGGGDPVVWRSADGRTWTRDAPDMALLGARVGAIRVLDGGARVVAVGGRPQGAVAFRWLGDRWQRDRIRRRVTACVRDVAAVGAIMVAVGGTCGASSQRGRAWTTPLGP